MLWARSQLTALMVSTVFGQMYMYQGCRTLYLLCAYIIPLIGSHNCYYNKVHSRYLHMGVIEPVYSL